MDTALRIRSPIAQHDALSTPESSIEKFLAAEPDGDVSRAQQRTDGPTDVLQDQIPDGMAVRVVDILEVVDVDHEGGDGRQIAAVVDRAQPAGGVGEIQPVVQPGQRIVNRPVVPRSPIKVGDAAQNLALQTDGGDTGDLVDDRTRRAVEVGRAIEIKRRDGFQFPGRR